MTTVMVPEDFDTLVKLEVILSLLVVAEAILVVKANWQKLIHPHAKEELDSQLSAFEGPLQSSI